ncbi:MAG: ABC transporter ATP-binding protein [Hyphomonadaceae bacterium]|nr:ABC transporter ATP-binding protein [Hyphomonadaceae bacterium]
MAVLSSIGLSKRFAGHSANDPSVLALSSVNFTINHNEFCSVLGHSGCGKTTLLTMVAGFEQPTEGELLLDGKPIGKPGWERSMIFQDYALFHWLTVEENISFGLEMKNVPRDERKSVVKEYINLVGLSGFDRRYPHQLSGGMRQRVSIARALAVNPQILLMDEPFAALDAQNRSLMQKEMVRIWERARKTCLLVTHSIDEAITLSDRILVMTRRPGTIKADIKVELPRPRQEDDPGVILLRRQIKELIIDEFEVER